MTNNLPEDVELAFWYVSMDGSGWFAAKRTLGILSTQLSRWLFPHPDTPALLWITTYGDFTGRARYPKVDTGPGPLSCMYSRRPEAGFHIFRGSKSGSWFADIALAHGQAIDSYVRIVF